MYDELKGPKLSNHKLWRKTCELSLMDADPFSYLGDAMLCIMGHVLIAFICKSGEKLTNWWGKGIFAKQTYIEPSWL